jgi:hypothetical protein
MEGGKKNTNMESCTPQTKKQPFSFFFKRGSLHVYIAVTQAYNIAFKYTGYMIRSCKYTFTLYNHYFMKRLI